MWSQLHVSKGKAYVETLLERAKGSALHITTSLDDPVGTIMLFSPHTAQIRYLSFEETFWEDVQRFSEVNSGPLPLLHTLRISAFEESNLNVMTPPSLPLFTGAINLKEFVLQSERSPCLHHFVFPNLTTFELSAMPAFEGFNVSQLLDFLEASPMLQTVHMKIINDILLEDVPRERVVVLPSVETFSLIVSEGRPGYEIAARVSCPSARHASFMHERDVPRANIQEIFVFPTFVPWSAIARQYTKGPVEGIALEIKFSRDPLIECSITFQSPDATTLKLGFQINESEEEEEFQMPFEEMHYQVFHQASRTIRDHPLLENVKRLDISHRALFVDSVYFLRLTEEVEQLFKSMGPLEELTTFGCDLNLYFGSFLELSGSHGLTAVPPVRKLTISHPSYKRNKELCMAAIVGLAKSRHALGIPFEHLNVCMERLPTVTAERLEPWVGAVDCREEVEPDYDYY